jgi:hypothetical protein
MLMLEQQVMKLQESKKELAGVLLSPHDKESNNDNVGTLKVSFSPFPTYYCSRNQIEANIQQKLRSLL